MFNKLKERLKRFFKKAEKKAEEVVTKQEKEEKVIEETLKGVEKKSIEGKRKDEKAEKKTLLQKIKEKFKFKISEEYFEEIFSDLEFLLLENNIALEVVEKVKSDLKQELVGLEIEKDEVEKEIKKALKISLESLFSETFNIIEKIKAKEGTFIIVFFGINGSGKTTTIAKIAYLLKKNNISCILAASDTFRAASIEQLESHGEKLGLRVIKSRYGADPSSVAFDAIKHAQAKNIKVVLIDTAGRMHTKFDLMSEMGKICRVNKPDLKIFVAESITGNDAIEQAKTFQESAGIDAIILTKSDVDEKGGTAISVSYITGKPILFLGTGQSYESLEKFDENKLIKRLGL